MYLSFLELKDEVIIVWITISKVIPFTLIFKIQLYEEFIFFKHPVAKREFKRLETVMAVLQDEVQVVLL